MPRPSRSTVFVMIGVLCAVVLVAASWITIPYYGEGPGPAREVTPLISFDGRQRYEPAGTLVMTTVRERHLTLVTALAAWLDPEMTVRSAQLIYPPGSAPADEQRLSFSEMDQSKIDATYVVLRELTRYPKEHGSGALIESTVPGCSADGHLFPGDVVTAIDGEPIDSRSEASRLIERAPVGRELSFALDVDGASEHAAFARTACVEGADPLVGVSIVDTFPFRIAISSGEIGGPSAGLMWAIGLYELLTPGDLTGGATIAGTGTIDLTGRVGGIGGIVDKVLGAEHAGASLFLVPQPNMVDLQGVDTGSMRVVPVSTFDEAIHVLRAASTQA